MKSKKNTASRAKLPPHLVSLRKKLLPIFRKHGVKKAGVFGSYARGDYTSKSDVDLLVQLPSRYSLFDLSSVEIEVEKKIGKNADVLTYDSIHSLLKKKIMSEEVRLV